MPRHRARAWSSALTVASRVMPAEAWRQGLARSLCEATGAEFVSVGINQPGSWRLQLDTFPHGCHPFVDFLDTSIRPRTENTPDEWGRAYQKFGAIYAPFDTPYNVDLAEEARAGLWDLARSRGLVVSFLVDRRRGLLGVFALGARAGARPILDREAGSLAQAVSVAAGTLGGALDLAQACGYGLPGRTEALARLSAREREVAELAAEGLSSLSIGARLGISEGTVSVHLKRVYRKLGVGSRVELALRVHRGR